MLTLHRVRQGYVEERTATINRMRGLMAEFGVVLAQRSVEVRRGAARAAEALPGLARQVIEELLEHLRLLDARIEDYERRLGSIASNSEAACRLMQQQVRPAFGEPDQLKRTERAAFIGAGASRMLTNRPVIDAQSDLLLEAPQRILAFRGSPYRLS